MDHRLNLDQAHSPTAMSPTERNALLASASSLKGAAQSGRMQPLLRGKNIGLLCEASQSADADLFMRAASELGARVARIRPTLTGLPTPADARHIAHMLGRLYDAIECQGLPAALVQQIREEAGVPVYDGIGCADHPSTALATMLDGDATDIDNRRYVLQALLLSTLR